MQRTRNGIIWAVAACGVMLLPHRIALADTEKPKVVLTPANADLVVGPRMNAAGRDLRGCEFVTQNLNGAVFDGCNLYSVRIACCSLKGASFRNALFTGSRIEFGPLDGADLTGATINGVRKPGGAQSWGILYGVGRISPDQLMSTWSYKNKDLHQCEVYGPRGSEEPARFDFREADLRQATLLGNLTHSDFTDARIFGAYFGGDSVTFKQLASTHDFKEARLSVYVAAGLWPSSVSSGKWDFSGVNLSGSSLRFPPSDVDFTDATIRDCQMERCLTKAHLYSTASYKQGDLTGLRLRYIDLSGCDLSGQNLTGCKFTYCKLAGAKFNDAVITGADFSAAGFQVPESDHLTLEQIKSTWNYKHGRMAGIELPEELAKALEQEAQTTEEEPAAGESGEKTEAKE